MEQEPFVVRGLCRARRWGRTKSGRAAGWERSAPCSVPFAVPGTWQQEFGAVSRLGRACYCGKSAYVVVYTSGVSCKSLLESALGLSG